MLRKFFLLSFFLSTSLLSTLIANNENLDVLNLMKYPDASFSYKRCSSEPRGRRGPRGHRGPRGRQGPTGPRGATGATGAAGENAPGMIIPFASGRYNSATAPLMTTFTDGTPNLGVLVTFGSVDQTPTDLSSQSLDLSGFGSYAFTMSRDGTLTSISATFNLDSIFVAPAATTTIHAQIWTSTPESLNVFTPLAGAIVDLSPKLPAQVFPPSVYSGIATGLGISLPAQTRVMIVFFATATSFLDGHVEVKGDYSAGISIE